MNINRHNYEEFFLLYADKELSPAEKLAVDDFVMENPDLQEELSLLLSSILKADNTILFENKISLVREDEARIQDHEEKFLLYHDNELSQSEKTATEKLLISNPSLQNEFDLLQQLKLEPDTAIVYPDKNLLYKKDRKVVYMNLRRALAAAILVGAGLWAGITYLEKNKTGDNIIPTAKQGNNIKPPKQMIPIADSFNYVTAPTDNIKLPEEKNNRNAVVSSEQNPMSTPEKSLLPIEKIIPDVTKKPQLPQQDVAIILPKKEEPIVTNPNSADLANAITSSTEDKIINATQNNFVKSASFLTEEEVKSENYIFYNVTQEEFRKSKIGIFLKKAKRVIERKNPLREKSFKVSSIPATQEN